MVTEFKRQRDTRHPRALPKGPHSTVQQMSRTMKINSFISVEKKFINIHLPCLVSYHCCCCYLYLLLILHFPNNEIAKAFHILSISTENLFWGSIIPQGKNSFIGNSIWDSIIPQGEKKNIIFFHKILKAFHNATLILLTL